MNNITIRMVSLSLVCSLLLPLAVRSQFRAENAAPINSPVIAYGIVDLGTLGGNAAFARDINNNGQVTGNANLPNGRLHAYLWDRGLMRDLGFLPNGVDFSRGFAINEHGVITGESDNDSSKAFFYDPSIGEMRSLFSVITENPDGMNIAGGFGAGINDAGHIVGTMSRTVIRGFIFNNGVVRDLGSIDGLTTTIARAWGINNFGQAVGLSRNAIGVSHATLWFNNTVTDLGSLGGETALSEALRINDRGQAVGRSVAVAGQTPQHAVLWEDGEITDLGRAADVNFARANDINNFGLIVGTVSQFENFSGRAAIWKPGDTTPTELNSLLPSDSGWTLLTAAEGVNDHGQIVGFGTKGGFTRAFVMTPFDVALTDQTRGITLLANSSSGDFKLIDCSTGRVYEGRGEISVSGCRLKLKYREFAGIELDMDFDTCRLTGSAAYGRTRTFRRTNFVDNEQGNAPNPGVCIQ